MSQVQQEAGHVKHMSKMRGQKRAHLFSTGMSREDYGESSI